MTHKDWMKAAFKEAEKGMRANKGGPFGAIVVVGGKIVGRGCNMVTSTNDPTAHAEVIAIRNACKKMKCFHLNGAIIYATCEPCPMCLAAIYWANINALYFSATRNDAKSIGFNDSHIYNEVKKPLSKRSIPATRIIVPEAKKLFAAWKTKEDKVRY